MGFPGSGRPLVIFFAKGSFSCDEWPMALSRIGMVIEA